MTVSAPRTPTCRQKALNEAWAIARKNRSDVYVHRRGADFFVTLYPIRRDQAAQDMCEFTVVTPPGTTRSYTPE